MKILAICDSHEAAASVMVDGEIVCAAAEERFTRFKSDMGFPRNAIDFCLRFTGLKGADFDVIVLPSQFINYNIISLKREAAYTIDDWLREMYEFWEPKLYRGESPNFVDIFKDSKHLCFDSPYDFEKVANRPGDLHENFYRERVRVITEYLDVPEEKLLTVTHEHAHAFYAYFASPIRGKAMVFTAEGGGEYSNGTVWEADEKGNLKELSHTKTNHLGHLYRFITLLLGMRPNQHEYKVMGLAPYANEKEAERSYNVLKNILDVEGLDVVVKNKPQDFYIAIRKMLEGLRFDGIAAGVQRVTEEILCKWIGSATKKFGINKVCFSGGVAQNIKACKSIAELPSVYDIYINPISGDGSLSIGAAYMAMSRYCEERGSDKSVIKPIKNIYLGPEYGEEDIKVAVAKRELASKFRIVEKPDTTFVVDQLVKDKIIARCSGRIEFGQRALGNRSIICNPRNQANIQKINSKIKFRDFWMPFTPTILAERENDYIVNPKGLASPFMTMAFESTELARKDLPAALHPADFTVRPQILERTMNPRYYDLIKKFEERTGVGVLLNTSLNLHGEPVVLTPDDAIHTFLNSGLDILLFDGTMAVIRDKK